jgi:hypothetical protein
MGMVREHTLPLPPPSSTHTAVPYRPPHLLVQRLVVRGLVPARVQRTHPRPKRCVVEVQGGRAGRQRKLHDAIINCVNGLDERAVNLCTRRRGAGTGVERDACTASTRHGGMPNNALPCHAPSTSVPAPLYAPMGTPLFPRPDSEFAIEQNSLPKAMPHSIVGADMQASAYAH